MAKDINEICDEEMWEAEDHIEVLRPDIHRWAHNDEAPTNARATVMTRTAKIKQEQEQDDRYTTTKTLFEFLREQNRDSIKLKEI